MSSSMHRHLDTQLEQRTRAGRPHGYGFLEIAIDESLLELGKAGATERALSARPNGNFFFYKKKNKFRWTFPPPCATRS